MDRYRIVPQTATVSAAKIFSSASRALASVSSKISVMSPVALVGSAISSSLAAGKRLNDQMQDAAR